MDDYPASEPIPDIEVQHHELLEFLMDNPSMRQAAKHSLQQGLWAGGGAVAGGLLAGPLGGLIGGIAGSMVGFVKSDDYDGVVQQIVVLESSRKERLIKQGQAVLLTAGATAPQFQTAQAFRGALVEFAARRQVRDKVWKACLDAVRSE